MVYLNGRLSGNRRPGREDTWNPNVVGLAKRDLLKDVLSVFCMLLYRTREKLRY